MSGKLEHKVVLITGASSGIGAETAATLYHEGASVVVSARRKERLEALRSRLGADDKRFLAVEADIRKTSDIESLVEKTLAWGDGLDILINNAGLSRGNMHETVTSENIALMLDTNVRALTYLTGLAIPPLKKRGGDIVNISSTAALSLIPGSAVYSATKAAVAAFSEVLRKELSVEYGVRLITLYPGLVETEFFEGFDQDKKERLLKMAEAMDALQARDLAETILFAVTRPPHVSLNEIVIRPTRQP